MKIQNINLHTINPYKTNQLKTDQLERTTKIQTDKIEISSVAKQLSEVSPFTVERNERVQQLKGKIDAGTYEVNAEQLASNLAKYYKA